MASECLYPVVIFFGAKLVIFIASIDYISILLNSSFASFMSRSVRCDMGGSVSVYILLSWENKLSVAAARVGSGARGGIHWPAAICFSSIFFRLRLGSILALNAREAPVEEEDKMYYRRESASFVHFVVAVAHSVFNYAALERVAYQAVSSFNVSHYRDMELTLLISPNKTTRDQLNKLWNAIAFYFTLRSDLFVNIPISNWNSIFKVAVRPSVRCLCLWIH